MSELCGTAVSPRDEQLKTDGWLASKIGLSSLGPTGFIFGFLVCYFIFVA